MLAGNREDDGCAIYQEQGKQICPLAGMRFV